MRQPEWKEMLEEYTRQLSEQLDYEFTEERNVTTFTENLNKVWRELARKYFDSLDPDELKYIINYLHVGTANQDYRSMMLDGEVMVVVAGWNALHGLMDFIFLMGNSEWVDSEEELQLWLPEQSNFKRKISRWMKIML